MVATEVMNQERSPDETWKVSKGLPSLVSFFQRLRSQSYEMMNYDIKS